MNPLVSTQWLAEHLDAPDLRIIDAAWYMPGDALTGRGEYAKEHLPGAVFFDIDAVADRGIDLPHMLPAPEAFAGAVGAMGVGDGDRVVVYDHTGLMASARVWWSLRVMGHERVYVLDGGLPRWKADGRPVTDEVPSPAHRIFHARFRPELVRDLDQIRRSVAAGDQIADARSPGRFSGAEPEPRAGLPSGHMPGSLNLPWQALARDGALRAPDDLTAAFKSAKVDVDRPLIATCGSGVSAAIIALAMARIGRPDTAVYDGSWTQWAGRDDTPHRPRLTRRHRMGGE